LLNRPATRSSRHRRQTASEPPFERVVLGEPAQCGLQRGINLIADAISPTLGPCARVVAGAFAETGGRTELMDKGGEIARRILQIPDRDADMGAMLIRDTLWRLYSELGDGTATAAVLYRSIYNAGLHSLAAGIDPRILRDYLERGMHLILEQLNNMKMPVQGLETLVGLATSMCLDRELAKALAEILVEVSEFGRIEIRSGNSRQSRWEYLHGTYWERGLVSRGMITDLARLRTEFKNGAVLITDLEFDEPEQLYPALDAVLKAHIPALLIVASRVSDRVLGFLQRNKQPERLQAVVVHTPGVGSEQMAEMEDLAVITGGRTFLRVLGSSLTSIIEKDLGRAGSVWADLDNFGVVDGGGDGHALLKHIGSLRTAFDHSDDPVARKKLRARIGKLIGGSATLWVGGESEAEIKARASLAERAVEAMRDAVPEGVIPGGGAALLGCRPVLRARLKAAANPEEGAAYRTLLRAVEAPVRTIIANSGYAPSAVLAEIEREGPGYGFDALAGKVVHMQQAGVYDAALVTKSAVYSAVSGAAQALTIHALVHHRRPEEAQPVPANSPTKRL